ncbi:MAG: YHYH protein [Flavobacteriaceae bacterium]|nr:YHYH protein [Flavobacteriaceae bacterium]
MSIFLGISKLDECNGRYGKTPESDNEYYYVFADNFSAVPLCFKGTLNNSFKNML